MWLDGNHKNYREYAVVVHCEVSGLATIVPNVEVMIADCQGGVFHGNAQGRRTVTMFEVDADKWMDGWMDGYLTNTL